VDQNGKSFWYIEQLSGSELGHVKCTGCQVESCTACLIVVAWPSFILFPAAEFEITKHEFRPPKRSLAHVIRFRRVSHSKNTVLAPLACSNARVADHAGPSHAMIGDGGFMSYRMGPQSLMALLLEEEDSALGRCGVGLWK
jgi:hypothetical protein